MNNILVTGGAGFIGSFIADELVKQGHFVRIFDNLEPRIHGEKIPSYLNKKAEFIKGDVRDYSDFSKALEDIDIVFHEASLVGIEPSMKDVKEFIDINCSGTANLLDIIIKKDIDIKKIIVPGSVAIYGEAIYVCGECGERKSEFRSSKQLRKKLWGVYCPKCNKEMKAINIPEDKKPYLNNIYSLTKYDQEVMCLSVGKEHGIPVTALRYFNVYGPRQSAINPYSGVITKFINNILANKDIQLFEDGGQSRDFVNIHDVVQANILAMNNSKGNFESFNVGTGEATTIRKIADTLMGLMNADIKFVITEEHRAGDIRNCTADITKIKNLLGYEPEVDLKTGLKEVIEWHKNKISDFNEKK